MSPRTRKRLGLADKPNPNKAALDAKLATGATAPDSIKHMPREHYRPPVGFEPCSRPAPHDGPCAHSPAGAYTELLAKDKTIATRYTAVERSLMEFSADNAMRVHGAPLSLSQFAEVLLRGAAVDYTAETDANSIECKRLLRGAWMFVREQLAADRWIGALARDQILRVIDENLARLE